MPPSFNLIDQPWIGAIDHAGQLREYSLRELLLHAHELRTLHDDSPLVIAATLRMILALLHSAHNGPYDRGEWKGIWQRGHFEDDLINDYLIKWHDRFDLFSSEHPFYQSTKSIGTKAPLTVLLYAFGAGGSATLFDHTSAEPIVDITPSTAAKLLLTVHLYGFCGRVSGPAYFADGPCVRDALFFAEGDSLFETLVLNMLEYNEERPMRKDTNDHPAWEMDNAYSPERQTPFGYLDYLTWQDRRIQLVPEIIQEGIRVSEMVLTPGLQLDGSMMNQDPLKHFRIDKKYGHLSLKFTEDRALWRESVALLKLNSTDFQPPAIFSWLERLVVRGNLDRSKTLRCMAFGMATELGKQVINFYRSEHLPLPLAYFSESNLVTELEQSLTTAEQVKDALWKATNTVAHLFLVPDEKSGSQPDPKAVSNLRKTMGTERRYWSLLEPLFLQTMQSIPKDVNEAKTTWFDWLRQSAWDVFNQACEGLGDDPRALKAVVRGREQLAIGLSKVLKIDL